MNATGVAKCWEKRWIDRLERLNAFVADNRRFHQFDSDEVHDVPDNHVLPERQYMEHRIRCSRSWIANYLRNQCPDGRRYFYLSAWSDSLRLERGSGLDPFVQVAGGVDDLRLGGLGTWKESGRTEARGSQAKR